jgi:hypothetical protein
LLAEVDEDDEDELLEDAEVASWEELELERDEEVEDAAAIGLLSAIRRDSEGLGVVQRTPLAN